MSRTFCGFHRVFVPKRDLVLTCLALSAQTGGHIVTRDNDTVVVHFEQPARAVTGAVGENPARGPSVDSLFWKRGYRGIRGKRARVYSPSNRRHRRTRTHARSHSHVHTHTYTHRRRVKSNVAVVSFVF